MKKLGVRVCVTMEKTRCCWCNLKNPHYVLYHDQEWGVPHFQESYLLEMLLLESFQAGLSWECVLNKRTSFKEAYDNFDLEKIISYGKEKIQELVQNKHIIRNRRKIEASIENARIFKQIKQEYGTFYHYLKTFIKEYPLYETFKTTNLLSDQISLDLKKRGMKFVGTTIIYSYLQAIGIINSHEPGCFLYEDSKEFTLDK